MSARETVCAEACESGCCIHVWERDLQERLKQFPEKLDLATYENTFTRISIFLSLCFF